MSILVPAEAVILMGWWLWKAKGWDPEGWLDPLGTFSVGTVLVQVTAAVIVMLALNGWLGRRFTATKPAADEEVAT